MSVVVNVMLSLMSVMDSVVISKGTELSYSGSCGITIRSAVIVWHQKNKACKTRRHHATRKKNTNHHNQNKTIIIKIIFFSLLYVYQSKEINT